MTGGQGEGQTFSFDIQLTQSGTTISGGNAGIQIFGTISGQTLTAGYSQPALGQSGSFTWTISADGNAYGSYTSSIPNSGTSQLLRR